MIDDRIDIEARLIRVLDLTHDLPDHVVMRFARGRLNFAVNSESHPALPSSFLPSNSPARYRAPSVKTPPRPRSPDNRHGKTAEARPRAPPLPRPRQQKWCDRPPLARRANGTQDTPARRATPVCPEQSGQSALPPLPWHARECDRDARSIPKLFSDRQPAHSLRTASWHAGAHGSELYDPRTPAPTTDPATPK